MSQESVNRQFKFNQKLVDALPPHDPAATSREMEYSDQEVAGLKLLVSKNGRKTYYLRYSFRGRKRVIRIGEHGPLSVPEARKNEATFATWEHIDLEEGRWWIPETKAGKGRWVILNEPARALLKTVRSVPGNPYVFPGKVAGRPFGNAQDTFEKLKQLAGITDDLRIHDLRHTYASIAINQGATLYEVQHLLGHSNSQTTQRYAHMAEDTLRKASGKVGESVGQQQQQAVIEIGVGTGA